MSVITLKSKANTVYDYHLIDLSEFAVSLKADERRYEADMKNFLRGYSGKIEADEICRDDLVQLSLESVNPRFNKSHMTLRVGIGLYSRELEDKLVGLKLNEQKTLEVSDDDVTVTIEKISREVLPEVTDELALKTGIEGIATADDLREFIRFKQYDSVLEEKADDAFVYLGGEVARRSDIVLDDEELEIANADLWAQTEEALGDATDEEIVERTGNTRDDIRNQGKLIAENTLQCAAIGQELFELEDTDYSEFIKRKAAGEEISEEEAASRMTMTQYMIDVYAGNYLDLIEAYALKELKILGEAMD